MTAPAQSRPPPAPKAPPPAAVELRRQAERQLARLHLKAGRIIDVQCRIDTLDELDYYRHGGIMPYVLRSLAKAA